MVSAILVGFLVFLLIIFVNIGSVFICICCQNARQRRQIPVALSLPSNSNNNNDDEWRLEMGLGLPKMELLPVFNYSALTENNGGECAVCLCEFKEQEPCLLLPNCKHIFHSRCIDIWFSSHSNCPLCRGNVWPIPRVGMQEEAIQITPHHPPSDEAIAIQM